MKWMKIPWVIAVGLMTLLTVQQEVTGNSYVPLKDAL